MTQKQAEGLEEEVSKLARQFEYYAFQERLLDNVAMADYYLSEGVKQTTPNEETKQTQYTQGEQDIQTHNKLEHLLK